MKLEQQLVSRELSTKLQELGINGESVFYHVQQYYLDVWIVSRSKNSSTHKNAIPAYTVAELGEMLPDGYKTYFCNKVWCMDGAENPSPAIEENTEADARAKMLCFLVENKDLIK